MRTRASQQDPVQLDTLPREWDHRVAQRVLEGAVRRLTDEREVATPAATSVNTADARVDRIYWYSFAGVGP